MTLKSYLRMLLAAVTLLFVTSGCNDDDDKVGPPPSYSFSVAVSDVAQTEATVTVTPSNDQATYYYAAVKKAEFDTFESDAAYAQHILDNLKAIADKKVLPLSECDRPGRQQPQQRFSTRGIQGWAERAETPVCGPFLLYLPVVFKISTKVCLFLCIVCEWTNDAPACIIKPETREVQQKLK